MSLNYAFLMEPVTTRMRKNRTRAQHVRRAARFLHKQHTTQEVRGRYGCCIALETAFPDFFSAERAARQFEALFRGDDTPRFWWGDPFVPQTYSWSTQTEPRLIALCLFAAMLENP